MSKAFNENLLILDDLNWLHRFLASSLERVNQSFVRLPSSVPMSRSLKRFENSFRLVIHWECQHRHGGAILEELLEIVPTFDVRGRVIVITTNPAHEDVHYFNELGLTKIVRVEQNKLALQKAAIEIRKHFSDNATGPTLEESWRKVQKYIDRLNPKSLETHFDNVERAIEALRLKGRGSSPATVLDAKASVAFFRGRNAEAEDLWQQSLAVNPNYYRANRNLSLFFEATGRFEEALHLIHKLNKRNKNSISRMVQLGRVHRGVKEENKAEHYFNLALEKDKYCSRALNGLAELRFDQGLYDEAKGLLERSQSSNMTASYLNTRGIALVKQKKFQEALELYQNAQYVLPNQDKGPLLFYNIGLCYSRWGKMKMAREYLRLALIKNPNYSKAEQLLEKIKGATPLQVGQTPTS